jgi:hypothetical protein
MKANAIALGNYNFKPTAASTLVPLGITKPSYIYPTTTPLAGPMMMPPLAPTTTNNSAPAINPMQMMNGMMGNGGGVGSPNYGSNAYSNYGNSPANRYANYQSSPNYSPAVYNPVTRSSIPAGNYVGDKMMCMVGGENKCPMAELKFPPIPNGGFNSSDASHQAFVKWMTPVALYIQAKSGMPAAVIIAQAAQETGFGTSNRFRNYNSLFGHSCWRLGSSQRGSVQLGDKNFSWAGGCDSSRPSAEGGSYLSFHTREESVLAYLSNILQSGHYSRAASTIARAKQDGSPGVANADTVAQQIASAGYALDGGYGRALNKTMNSYNLRAMDNNVCQSCVNVSSKSSTGDVNRQVAGATM